MLSVNDMSRIVNAYLEQKEILTNAGTISAEITKQYTVDAIMQGDTPTLNLERYMAA